MRCILEVNPTNDSEALSYSSLVVTHNGCMTGDTTIHRNPATNEYSIRCRCGFEINFNEENEGPSKIMQTAITGQENTIDSSSYYDNECNTIVVRQRG